MSEFLTARQVAERLNVPLGTIHHWRAVGVGPRSVKLGPRQIRYRMADLGRLRRRVRAGPDRRLSAMQPDHAFDADLRGAQVWHVPEDHARCTPACHGGGRPGAALVACDATRPAFGGLPVLRR